MYRHISELDDSSFLEQTPSNFQNLKPYGTMAYITWRFLLVLV